MNRNFLTAIGRSISDIFRPREERGFDSHTPPMENKPLIALCVGHSRRIGDFPEGGAVSVGKESEWRYNTELVGMVSGSLKARGHRVLVINCYEGGSYGAAMKWLADHLRKEGADLAVELHFNSAGPTARGHEWLFWHASTKGQRLAIEFDKAFRDILPALPARGAKLRTGGDRGAEFLRLTHCPAVIAEPFFGSNASDWGIATERKGDIAFAMARAISAYAATL